MNRRLLIIVGVIVGLAGIAWGSYAWVHAQHHVSTDDAYVESPIAPLAAKVSGHVVDLQIVDNKLVKAGETLLRIDPRDYQAKVDQAKAAVAVATANFDAVRSETQLTRETTQAQGEEARAALEAARVAEQTAEATVDETRARLESRRAALSAITAEVAGSRSAAVQAAREKERFKKLVDSGYVSQREFDQTEAADAAAAAALEAITRRVTQAEREVQQAEAELAGRGLAVKQARQRVAELRATLSRMESQRHQVKVKEAETGRAEASLTQAKADLALAELQLSYTDVTAPIDGIVSRKSVELGQMVQVGQPLLAIVPLTDVWVLANFKETQLGRVRPGMPATVEIDTFPGQVFNGKVDSISAGTGARFSLLPPENATGNWVKVVQRIPVKIRLDSREFGNPHTLRAGMSAVVTVRVK
jgi:membrane fusion protein (multidrug efflux system)